MSLISIFIMVDENNIINGWSNIRTCESEIEVQIDDNDPFFNESPKLFIYKDGKITKNDDLALQKAKYLKDQELSQACNDAILNGFDYTINNISYHFSYDLEAQGNFRDAYVILQNGTLESIKWMVKNNETNEYERIDMDKNLIDELQIVIFNHKNNNISKYRDILYPQLMACATIDEVNAISW